MTINQKLGGRKMSATRSEGEGRILAIRHGRINAQLIFNKNVGDGGNLFSTNRIFQLFHWSLSIRTAIDSICAQKLRPCFALPPQFGLDPNARHTVLPKPVRPTLARTGDGITPQHGIR